MKRFEKFGEYMFDLLFGPLKKGKRAANQFYIFFKVIGRVFDGLKQDAFRVRDETNIASASAVMLPIHGQDRNMPRLAGEDIEAYRTRLAMKGIISEWGGTRQGIRYILAALGYEQSHIESVGPEDPERWAEFTVDLGVGNSNAVRDVHQIYDEIQTVKEGSSKLAELIITLPAACGQLPISPHLGMRLSETALPPKERVLPSARVVPAARLGWRMSVTTLPMAVETPPGDDKEEVI